VKKAPIALLFALAAVAIIAYPSTAGAIEVHKHITRTIALPDSHEPEKVQRTLTLDVAPADSDDDGCPDTEDSYNGPGCNPPPPPKPTPTVASSSSTSVAPPTPAPPSVPTTSAGGCPSYMAAEATSPTAVNPSSGAMGCYQVLPSTAAAMGAACSDVNSSSCVAAICAAQGNGAWSASGATPCG
jgi:hypothetical protein